MINIDTEKLKKQMDLLLLGHGSYQYSAVNLVLSTSFQKTYPRLSLLLRKAAMVKVAQGELFLWNEKESSAYMGWLCEGKVTAGFHPNFMEAHQILVETIGGITKTFCQNCALRLDLSQNFMFTPQHCKHGLGRTRPVYEDVCARQGCTPIPTEHLVMFAFEAGGIRSFYDPETMEVLVFAPDHNDEYLKMVPGQPELTFHTIAGVRTFTDYVETLAQQWLDWVV